jgi:RNA polymerase sigma factor (sigma-70 family)
MSQRDRLLDQIRRVALQGMGERRTDGQLLEHFISQRDEASFALLLRRHGAMVWSVCRRVLGNVHDADDAFQAAFLVLVRKADSVRPREAVGNWLYGVAYRTALEARCRIARRRAKELSLRDVPTPESKPEEPWQELWPILDRELSRLADKYRLPIVLCDLEGRSRKEVAQQLAIPEGTLSSRLATARKKLAARLTRLGFAVSSVSLAALLTGSTATAGMGQTLFTTTTKAALVVAAGPAAVAGVVSATVSSLTEGVVKTMFIAKIKTTALVLCSVAVLGAGTGGVYYQTRVGAADSPQDSQSEQQPPRKAIRGQDRSTDDWRRIAEDLRRELQAEREKAKERDRRLEAIANRLRDDVSVKEAKIEAIKLQAELRETQAKEELERQQRLQAHAILERLGRLEKRMDRLESSTVGGSSGNLGVLKYGGILAWPKLLQGLAFKESRERINELMRTAYRTVASGNNPDAATLNDLQVQHRKMRETLDNNVANLTPEEFIEANKYLRQIANTISALKDPNIGKQFNEKGMQYSPR